MAKRCSVPEPQHLPGRLVKFSCTKHGRSYACPAHVPFPIMCPMCRHELDTAGRERCRAEEAKEERERQKAEPVIAEFQRQGYSREEAEALAAKQARDDEAERRRQVRQARLDDEKRRYEEGTYGLCPRCNQNVFQVSGGIILAHDTAGYLPEYPWQPDIPGSPCSGVGERALPPKAYN